MASELFNPLIQLRRSMEAEITELFIEHRAVFNKYSDSFGLGDFCISSTRLISLSGNEEQLVFSLLSQGPDAPAEDNHRAVYITITDNQGMTVQLRQTGMNNSKTYPTQTGFRITADQITWAVHWTLRHLLELSDADTRVLFDGLYRRDVLKK